MLLEFSVTNFCSFKDKVTLSMESGNGEENLDNVCEENGLLKTVSIYGANASGKSNLIKALSAAIWMVRESNVIPLGAKWNVIKPFMFDTDSKNKPSVFEFVVLINDIKYRYYFSADQYRIYDEVLDAYYSQKPTNIFTRTNANNYTFTNDKSKLDILTSRNTENKLFLSTATTWNYDKTRDLFLWFNNDIDTFDSFTMVRNIDMQEYSDDNSDLKKFALNLLREADILIKDIVVDYEEREINSGLSSMNYNQATLRDSVRRTSARVEVEHEILDDNNNRRTYRLGFNEESSGTKVLFALAPILKRAFESNRTIVVDELERSMHPALIEYLVKLFNNKNINKANSQLIFTTHATNLLNLSILRRDQIWFTEKNPENGVSELYPLDSFSIRKDENIYKGYINGRYGAIPFIRDLDLWPEEQ